MNDYQMYQFKSKFARWAHEVNRRETWEETVDRYVNFIADRIPQEQRFVLASIHRVIYNLEVLPSMRALATAGKALERDNAAGYGCSFMTCDDVRSFDEAVYLSMCGVGVGFSVEQAFISKLPGIAEIFYPTDTTIHVADSRIGWATSFRQLLSLLYGGLIPKWDLSRLRPKGAILKTFGGRASGPEPLERLFKFATATFMKAAGRKLNALECHDLMCMIADIVQSGGVRRSAMISLSDLFDDGVRHAKSGDWGREHGYRSNANNSAVYLERPDVGTFMREWLALYESRSGERGIFNREAVVKKARENGRREVDGIPFGSNPCGEIILRPQGFCNLSEVVLRPKDTIEEIREKVILATIMGTIQSTLTDFRYLRSMWKRNAEEERLLGVSFTGIMDHIEMATLPPAGLNALRDTAIATNKEWASILGIRPSAAITCVKPSGDSSQLVGSASGIHPRYSKYYIRAVREDEGSPVAAFLKAAGVPNEIDAYKPGVGVFYFPIESPDGVLLRDDVSALQQLAAYLLYRRHWCEHNPSTTIYIRDHEWLYVASWVRENFNEISGLSFLPHSDHDYPQAPYREITKEEYEKALRAFPALDWSKLQDFESTDNTTAAQQPACSGGRCET